MIGSISIGGASISDEGLVLNTFAGYGGAGETFSPYFANTEKDTSAGTFSWVSDSTNGTKITLLKKALVYIGFCQSTPLANIEVVGITRNSSNRAVSVGTLPAAELIKLDSSFPPGGNVTESDVGAELVFEKDEIIGVQTNAGIPLAAAQHRSKLIFTVIAEVA
jgi:hypothetical protein